jgi:hypothetical protein
MPPESSERRIRGGRGGGYHLSQTAFSLFSKASKIGRCWDTLLCHSWPWSGSVSPVLITMSEIAAVTVQCTDMQLTRNPPRVTVTTNLKMVKSHYEKQVILIPPQWVNTFYVKVTKCSRDAIQWGGTKKWRNSWIFPPDNAPPNSTLGVQRSVKNQIPAISLPDLTPCD